METQRVLIGSVTSGRGGFTQDNTHAVEFVGEELGKLTIYGVGRDGGITDTRGVTQTLYRAEDGRLVVHVQEWSHWQEEPTTYTLLAATEADLGPDGAFEDLGYECGFGRPLTLDEALQR